MGSAVFIPSLIHVLTNTSCNQELYARNTREALILFAREQGNTILEINESLYDHGFAVPGTLL